MAKVKPIPEGTPQVIPHLVCRGAAEALEFYKKAFGAVELTRSPIPNDGRLMHSAIRIGNSVLHVVDEFPEYGAKSPATLNGSPVTIHVYVEDVDATAKNAIAAGATLAMPVQDMFWGDRYGKLVDPFGHHWSIASRIREMSPAEMQQAAAAAFAKKPG